MRVPTILELDTPVPVGTLTDVKLMIEYGTELGRITELVVTNPPDTDDAVIETPNVVSVCVLWIVTVVSLEVDKMAAEGEL